MPADDGVVRVSMPSDIGARRAHYAAQEAPAADPLANVIEGCRPATADELATGKRTLVSMMRKAESAGWRVVPTYALAWSDFRKLVKGEQTDEGKAKGHYQVERGKLATIALRMTRSGGRERAVAVYATRADNGLTGCKWAFDLAYCWGGDQPISRRSSTDLAAYLIQTPVDQVVESCAA